MVHGEGRGKQVQTLQVLLIMRKSLFDIFKVGLGPSSSHTVGPMLAANHFMDTLSSELKQQVRKVEVHLYGSLALTGKGHGTDRAVILGLAGQTPREIDLDRVEEYLQQNRLGKVIFHPEEWMPDHPNGLRFTALDADGGVLASQGYYSVGGGAIRMEGEALTGEGEEMPVPHPFTRADDLLRIGEATGLSIWQIGLENELARHSAEEVEEWLSRIWTTMQSCVQRGLQYEGILPGGLDIPRRAPGLARTLREKECDDGLSVLDWVNCFALAVNEENAVGSRVVTAPTNGAAGIIPAVAHYYQRFVPGSSDEGLRRYFLTAAVIGVLYKENASISGADVGCQGEVGVASSMAAGGLVAAYGGSNRRVEKAAEIAMEHHLGMTCDPIAGLVQIPCIERNAMGSVKAINACRIAMLEGEEHRVTLDNVIQTMLQTGRDMRSKYKETSLGGLAVAVPLC